MAGEVERGDRPGPRRRDHGGTSAGDDSPRPCRSSSGRAVAVAVVTGAGAGGAAPARSCRATTISVVTQRLPMNSNTIELTRSGCSMWTKWPASSSISQRPPGGMYGMTSAAACPSPSPRRPRRGCRGTASAGPGRRSSVHSGRHGPKPPKRIAGSIFQRQPSSISRPADGHQIGAATRPDRRGFIRPRRRASSSSVPGSAPRGRRAAPMVEPAGELARPSSSCGRARRRRASRLVQGMPSMLTRCENRNGWASASCDHQRPALGVPDHGHRSTGRH